MAVLNAVTRGIRSPGTTQTVHNGNSTATIVCPQSENSRSRDPSIAHAIATRHTSTFFGELTIDSSESKASRALGPTRWERWQEPNGSNVSRGGPENAARTVTRARQVHEGLAAPKQFRRLAKKESLP